MDPDVQSDARLSPSYQSSEQFRVSKVTPILMGLAWALGFVLRPLTFVGLDCRCQRLPVCFLQRLGD